MDFTNLGIDPRFGEILAGRGIRVPTGIQRRIIPRLLDGENVIFSSATGTGKTFAYLLPFFQRMLRWGPPKGPALLILAPTFELCVQIRAEADFLLDSMAALSEPPPGTSSHPSAQILPDGAAPEAGGTETPASEADGAETAAPEAAPRRRDGNPLRHVRTGLVIGGTNMTRQIDSLKDEKPCIIIGNPGRVLLLARMGKIKTRFLDTLVLDEGDRLVADELFEETAELLRLILAGKDEPPQISASSATMPPKSRERLLPFIPNAVIDDDLEKVLENKLFHWAIYSERRRKVSALRSFIAAAKPRKTLVFTSRGGDVANIAAQLQHHHHAAAGLHGKMERQGRRQALEDFRLGRVSVLVTSDLAARGLDIGGISHVVALDLPSDENAYLHRAGRTARAGNRGVMVTIGDEEEMHALARLEKKLGIVIYPKELYNGKVVAPAPDPEQEPDPEAGAE